MKASPPLQLSIHAASGKTAVSFLRRHVPRAHRLIRTQLCEVSIALVGDKRMGDLHEEFMSIAGPTDVLTFPLDTDAKGRVVSGEIVICVPWARRSAKALGLLPEHELLLYAIHGILHLSGHDDRTPRAFRTMHDLEDRLLKRLGFGAVFKAQGRACC